MKCLNCQKETNNPKFCSRKCAQTINNTLYPKRLRKAKCVRCDNITKSWKHSLCEEHWKDYISTRRENIENRTLSEYWKLKSLSTLHSSSKNAHIRGLARSWFKELVSKPCHKCHYDRHVELCHIRPISSFTENDRLSDVNAESNLI